MGSFVIYLSPVVNTPRSPFIFPCYFCQVAQFKIPLKYRPLHTLTISPASPLLQIHFKLEDLHFEHHPTSSSSNYLQNFVDLPPVHSTSDCAAFFQLLGQQWCTNLEIVRLFLAEPNHPSIKISNKRTLVADCLHLDEDLL